MKKNNIYLCLVEKKMPTVHYPITEHQYMDAFGKYETMNISRSESSTGGYQWSFQSKGLLYPSQLSNKSVHGFKLDMKNASVQSFLRPLSGHVEIQDTLYSAPEIMDFHYDPTNKLLSFAIQIKENVQYPCPYQFNLTLQESVTKKESLQ